MPLVVFVLHQVKDVKKNIEEKEKEYLNLVYPVELKIRNVYTKTQKRKTKLMNVCMCVCFSDFKAIKKSIEFHVYFRCICCLFSRSFSGIICHNMLFVLSFYSKIIKWTKHKWDDRTKYNHPKVKRIKKTKWERAKSHFLIICFFF